MALISPDGRWFRVNDRFCLISGHPREKLVGHDFKGITHPDDVAADVAHINDLLTGKTTQCYAEKRFVRPSGDVVWANVSAALVRHADGKPDFIVKIIEEVTDWKNAQAQLLTGEAQYRAIFDSAVEAIAVIDEKGVIQSLNPAAKQVFGYEQDEVIGRNISMLMPKAVARNHDSYLARYKETGKRAIIGIGREVAGLRKDGTLFPLDLSVAEWKQEGLTFYTGIMRDVTVRKEAVASLAASEERLRLAQSATGIGSFDWDILTGEIFGNDGYYEIIGIERQTKLFADSLISMVHPDERQRMILELREDSLTDDHTDRELRLADRDGRPRWVRSLMTTMRDSDNRPYRRTGIIVDISQRKEAEEVLRESEERLRIALASGHFGTWTVDSTKASVELDPIARGIFDLEPNFDPDLFEFAALMHPDDQARYARVREGILADAPTLDFEYRIIRRDGSVRWLHATGTRFGDEESATKMIGVVRDVTQQKEAVEMLRQSEERLRLALASGDLGTWSFDPKSQQLHFDQLAQAIFRAEGGQLDGLNEFKALLHPEDRPVFDREYQKLIAGSDTLNVEYRLLLNDGSVRWAHVSGTIDRGANPDSPQLIGVVADVTDKRESAERLRVLQNEFAHLARVNDLGEMAAAIAHEINQPLTAIANYLNAGLEIAKHPDKLKLESGPEPMMERAAEQALRAGQIVRRLREFIGKGTGEREDRPADELIDAVTEFAAVDAAVNGVSVIRNGGASGAIVSVDVVQFQQVVLNLIRNAIEALSINPPEAERKLTIETRIANSGKAVEFIIADTGPGIVPEIGPKLFEPFTTSKANGMGMGLSVCRRLIEAHGGSIEIESPSTGGATFRFSLPLVRVEA
jgi:two-component system sensor kinase FixL